MIFLKFTKEQQLRRSLPEIVSITRENYENIRKSFKFVAYDIFEFHKGSTLYLKNRDGLKYQYTDEEQVLIKLKAIML